MTAHFTLISHLLCPYVQRAVIVLHEKDAPFERRDVDLANKPDWFLALSPLGKTPVLQVDGEAIFESAVISEFLDETLLPRLHPEPPLERAKHRAFIELSSATLNSIWAFYTATDEHALAARALEIRSRFAQLEKALADGPYFAGTRFSIVDAAFGPVFRYFDVFDAIDDFGCLTGLPKVNAWRQALTARPSVRQAVRSDYPDLLRGFLLARKSALSRRMESLTSA